MGFVNRQLNNLPIRKLISEPLQAACEAQVELANASMAFIRDVGFARKEDDFSVDDDAAYEAIYVEFSYNTSEGSQTIAANGDAVFGEPTTVTKKFKVPLLALVHVPSLFIDEVKIDFKCTVTQSSNTKIDVGYSSGVSVKYWGVKAKTSFKASISNTNSRNYSADYSVSVLATDHGYTEGMTVMLDALTKAAVDTVVEPAPQ